MQISGGGANTMPDGNAVQPGFPFESERATGWFRAAAGVIAASIAGVKRAALSVAGTVGRLSVFSGAVEGVLEADSAGYVNVGGKSAHPVQVLIGGGARYQLAAGYLISTGDNRDSCGAPANRFTAVYATNGTIQTSDEEQKRLHGTVDPRLALDVAAAVPVWFFEIPPEGGEPDTVIPWHIGVLTQDLPEWLQTVPDGSGLSYASIAALALAAAGQARREISALEARLNAAGIQ